jgi:hypothetical protein
MTRVTRKFARVCCVATSAMILGAAVAPLVAQRGNASPRPRGTDKSDQDATSMTAAERAAATSVLDEIHSVFEKIPELARPRGFEVERNVAVGGAFPVVNERGVVTYGFGLWFYAPSKAATFGEGSPCIVVSVNKATGSHQGIVDQLDSAGRGHYIEQDVGVPKPGSTIVYEGLRWDEPNADRRPGYVIFTTGGRSPWIPITREQHLRALIFAAGGKNGETEREVKAALEKTAYEEWIAGAAERKKVRDAAVATRTRTQGSAAGDELRKELEQTERDVTAQLKAGDAEDRAQRQGALANRYVEQLRAQLAALTPAQRAAPAMVGASGAPVDAGAPQSHRLLTPDPEFWRVRRSRVEVHGIQVVMTPTFFCANPAVRAALERVYETLDWAALKRIVDRPW